MIIAQKSFREKEMEKELGNTKERLNELKEDYEEILKQVIKMFQKICIYNISRI